MGAVKEAWKECQWQLLILLQLLAQKWERLIYILIILMVLYEYCLQNLNSFLILQTEFTQSLEMQNES